MKPIPKGNKGLPKLPKKVRNNMGFLQMGGMMPTEERKINPTTGMTMKYGGMPTGKARTGHMLEAAWMVYCPLKYSGVAPIGTYKP